MQLALIDDVLAVLARDLWAQSSVDLVAPHRETWTASRTRVPVSVFRSFQAPTWAQAMGTQDVKMRDLMNAARAARENPAARPYPGNALIAEYVVIPVRDAYRLLNEFQKAFALVSTEEYRDGLVNVYVIHKGLEQEAPPMAWAQLRNSIADAMPWTSARPAKSSG